MSELEPVFERLLRPHLPLLAEDQALRPDHDLAELGLDSLATVALLVDIEENYDLMVPDHVLTLDTFASPEALWTVVSKLIADRQP